MSNDALLVSYAAGARWFSRLRKSATPMRSQERSAVYINVTFRRGPRAERIADLSARGVLGFPCGFR
jgi:hypothetical protein